MAEFYPNEWDSISEEAKAFIKNLIVVDPAKRLTVDQVYNSEGIDE